MRNILHPVEAAGGHMAKEHAQFRHKQRSTIPGRRNQPREEVIGQQADTLGEETEQDTDKEMRDPLRIFAILAQQFRQLGKLSGSLFRILYTVNSI